MNEPMRRLRELLGRLPETSEIARRMAAAGVAAQSVREPSDLARIPVLKKETLPALHREPGALEALLPFGGLARVSRVFYSPAGIFDFEAREGAHWRSAGALGAAGVGAGDVVLNTFSYHLTPAARLADEGAIALGASVVPAGPGQIPVQLELMRRLGVTVYVGLPSFLGMLIDAAAEHGIDWKRDLRVRKAVVGAEPIAASARRRFEEDCGIEVYTIYGTADAGMIGFECERRDGWHLDEALIVEVCDPASGAPLAPGEAGEVVVTLPREVYPLVRLGLGDLSRLRAEPCACGRPGARLAGLLGRANQAVKVRGMFVYPAFAHEIARPHGWIEAVRLRVEREGDADRMAVLVLPRPGARVPQDVAGVEKTVREVTKLRGDVSIVDPAAFRASDKLIEDLRRWD